MKSFYESLEFQKVKDIIVTLAKTEVAKEKINNLEIILDQNELQKELDILKEMHSFLSRYNELPISNSSLLIDIITHGEKTGILSVYDLEKVASDISTIKRVQTSFEKCKDEFPLLDNLISSFIDLSSLEDLIHSVISPSLTIYDDASVDLKRIRRNIASLESDLSTKIHNLAKSYSGYLTDNTVTLRNGHYVLPVKTMYKFKVEGIIHDTSDSGNTVFVEPANIVEINNNYYLDGAICDSIPIKKALSLEYDRIIVILTREKGFIKKPFNKGELIGIKTKDKKYPKFIKALSNRPSMYNETIKYIEKKANNHEIIFIRPSQDLKVKRIEKNKKKLSSLYTLGQNNTKEIISTINKYLTK